MFLIIQLYLTYRKDCMQSPTREEMMELQMYDTIADKNDASGKCTILLQKYKRRMMQVVSVR